MEALSSTWFKVLLFYACFWYVCVVYLAQEMYVQQKQDCIANSVSPQPWIPICIILWPRLDQPERRGHSRGRTNHNLEW